MDKGILDIQPEWCRNPLPKKKIEYDDWEKEHPEYIEKWEKVLFFDPIDIYDRIANLVDPHERILSISVGEMFPDIKGYCACGCGVKLTGRRRRWASNVCGTFAFDIRSIICNTYQRASFYIEMYFGICCIKCGGNGVQLDHIFPVKHGGGGSWLSNYQFLCNRCHRTKTNKDFNWKGESHGQLKLIN